MPKGVFERSSTRMQLDALGISYEEFLQARLRYYSQVKTARKRKITWKFTFQTWVKWWRAELGPEWVSKRGRNKGQFVMARKGDKGPYAPENVKLTLATENVSDQKKNGTRGRDILRGKPGSTNVKAKLREVDIPIIRKKIKNGMRVALIAKEYGVNVSSIYRANKNGWRHVE